MSTTTPRSRTFTWEDPAALAAAAASMSGMEFFARLSEGELPPPPIAELLGFAVTEAEPGRVVAEGTVVHTGRRQATADGRLTVEATGKLIATGTTGCTVL